MWPEPNDLRPVRIQDAETRVFLAVRSLAAQVQVDGPVARTRLAVVFHNDLERTLEGDLVFPLPPSAALSELTVQVGERALTAKIRPRQRAQAEYTRAMQAGRTATLGETEGEDLARLRVAPIEQGQDVTIRLGLCHLLLPTDTGRRLLLPLTYMPRFVEDEQALKPTERAAVDRPRPLTLAARATVTVEVNHSRDGAPAIRCTSHATRSTVERTKTIVTVEQASLDRDLHLDIADRPKGGEPALWLCHDPAPGPDALGPATALSILPPAFAEEGPTIARTVTFLLDRSGSMQGGPMQAAIRAVRGSLRALGTEDMFNVIAFDDVLEVLARRPVAFTQKSLQAADAFLAGIHARGGTSASMALVAALGGTPAGVQAVALPEAPAADAAHRLRVIVFMTDGDVAGAEQVLKAEKDKLVDARIHVIGIGHSVNHAMLGALAAQGGGTYIPVATDEDLEKALARLKNAIDAPLWTGIRMVLQAEDGERRSPKAIEPPEPRDLFAAEPLLIAFRGPVHAGDRLVIEGQGEGGQDRTWTIPLSAADLSADAGGANAAGVVWALLRNRRLTYRFNSEDDATLEGLGVSFGMVNRTVALVAVHDDPRSAVVEGSVPVVLPMPGNIMDWKTRFGGPPPGAPSGPPGAGRGAIPPPAAMAGAGMRAYAMAAPPRAHRAAAPASQRPSTPRSLKAARAPMPRAFPTPPPPPAPMPADEDESLPPARAAGLADNEAGLRALFLHQGADGLFAGELGSTLAAVAAVVSRGHTPREGLFRAELRRTVATLRKKLPALGGDDRIVASLALALLTVPSGEAPPEELPDALAAMLSGLSLQDLPAARTAIEGLLAAAPASWQSEPLAKDIGQVFFERLVSAPP